MKRLPSNPRTAKPIRIGVRLIAEDLELLYEDVVVSDDVTCGVLHLSVWQYLVVTQ